MKISMDKKYRTRSGLPVRVLCVDRLGETEPVVALAKRDDSVELILCTTPDGKYFSDDFDLIEVSPYDDFKIDEPVMVRDHDSSEWLRRYFAGVDTKGDPLVWVDGKTSWTTQNKTRWDFCRRPTEEELK